MSVRRHLDTVAVVRGVGARVAANAALRRLSSEAVLGARSWWHRISGTTPAPALCGALRVMPSPLAEEDDELRLGLLERERPGAVAAIRDRAAAAVEQGGDAGGMPGDPRCAWEPHRLARLVAIAAGVRAAAGPAEEEHLRAAFERIALAWIDDNPPGTGAWQSPLEVALRAWNLWVALALARPARLSDAAVRALAGSLAAHARSIDGRLEDQGLVVGSHLLGELVGLYACGAALQMAGAEARRWIGRARARLEREARRQSLPDGGGAEGSTGYGRFVAELCVAAAVIARGLGDEAAGPAVAARRMLDHLAAGMAPDGRDVGIGDDDGSRVLPPAARDARDLRALVPLAAALCGAPTRPEGIRWSEEAAWLCGAQGFARFAAAAERPWPRSVAMTSFGLYLGRRGGPGGDLVALRAGGGHGQGGAGGHAHNDPLAVAIWLGGQAVVIDPGTGVYLGRRALRDRFRGVAAHATVCVDGQEPSPLLLTRPFALPDLARARPVRLDDGEDAWSCSGRHEGYRRLGLICRREVRMCRATGAVTVIDEMLPRGPAWLLEGGKGHEVIISFPLASTEAAIVGDAVRFGPPGAPIAWLRAGGDGLAWRLDPAPRSPEYAHIVPGLVARRVGRAHAPARIVTIIEPAAVNPRED